MDYQDKVEYLEECLRASKLYVESYGHNIETCEEREDCYLCMIVDQADEYFCEG